MIKRPFILILSFYLGGMALAWRSIPYAVVVPIFLVLCLSIYLLLYRISLPWISKQDKFLCVLPFLMLLGFVSMKGQLIAPELDHVFKDKLNCEVSGTISMIVQKQSSKALYIKKVTVTVPEGEAYLCENIIVYCSDQKWGSQQPDESLLKQYLVGNQITVHGTLQKFSTATNPGQFNEKLYYQMENIDYKVQAEKIVLIDSGYSKFHAVLDEMKQKLITVYESILSEKEAGTLIAMILGEKYLLDDEIKQLYQMNGISHVLAISGLHISLIGMFIFHLLKKLKVPIVAITFITIFFIYCYGVLTDFSVSTNRAVVMMTVMLLAALFGKTYDMLSSLSLSAFLILLQNPLQIMSAGFLLSFAAVLGIAVIFPALQKLYQSKNVLINSLFISFSAQVATTPIVLYFYYQFPLYSLLTNLIILPFVTILTLTSILAGFAGVILLQFGVFLIGGSNYILKFYEWICEMGGKLPCNLITIGRPDWIRICLYLIIITMFLIGVHRYQKKVFGLLTLIALLVILFPQNNQGLSITMLDVGQGDAIVLESENGTTYMIDGGSSDVKNVGKYRLLPFLLSQGIDSIDFAIVSHSDNDHISGLKELMDGDKVSINTLILPDIQDKDDAYIELENMAMLRGINIQYIHQGDVIRDGKLHITCLHPNSNYQPSSINGYSTVLAVNYGEFDMLLTGDLEEDGEELVMELLSGNLREGQEKGGKVKGDEVKDEAVIKGGEVEDKYTVGESQPFLCSDFDVLKVAHHGSKYS